MSYEVRESLVKSSVVTVNGAVLLGVLFGGVSETGVAAGALFVCALVDGRRSLLQQLLPLPVHCWIDLCSFAYDTPLPCCILLLFCLSSALWETPTGNSADTGTNR